MLEFIDLSHSRSLVKTPNFEGLPNLKELVFDGCTRLVEVHPSIGDLRGLIFLSLKNCRSLKKFSKFIGLESLEILVLSGCSKLKKLPDFLQPMEHLLELYLDETAIKELPSSIENLSGLVYLNLRDCKNLVCIPDGICSLMSLRFLILAGCINLKQLPEKLRCLLYLDEIDVGRTSLKELPPSIICMNHLNKLSCNGCNSQLQLTFPSFFESLGSGIELSWFRGLSLPPFSGFRSLRILQLNGCDISKIPEDIFSLEYLTDLDFSNNYFFSIPSLIVQLSMLEYLRLNYCKQLKLIPKLPASIAYVYACGCVSLEGIAGTSLEVVPGKTPGQQWDFQSFLTNCLKMAGHQGFSVVHFLEYQLQALLKRQLLGHAALFAHVKIIVPGSDIPSWFSHQSTESSLTVDPCSGLGLAVCVVFKTYNHQDRGTPYCLNICVQFSEGNHVVTHELQFDESVSGDHLGLCYVAFPSDWQVNSGYIGVSLEHNKQVMEVKRFGVRLINNADLKDNNIVDKSKNSFDLLD